MPDNTLTPAQKFLQQPGVLVSIPAKDTGYTKPGISIEHLEEYVRLLKEEWDKEVVVSKSQLKGVLDNILLMGDNSFLPNSDASVIIGMIEAPDGSEAQVQLTIEPNNLNWLDGWNKKIDL